MAIKNEHLSNLAKNIVHELTPQICDLVEVQHEYLEREPLETDPTYRQVIPYILVESPKGFCLMQRCKGQGEARLLGKHYIGAGGHVEDGHSIYYTALKECTEELGLPLRKLELTGLMLTDGSPVDDVHVCVLGKAYSDYTDFKSPEGSLHNAQWVSREELLAHADKMEKWSQLIVNQLLS